MQAVLTLIANPARPALTTDLAAAFGASIDWLEPGVACDVPVETDDPRALEAETRARLAGAPIDLAVLPRAGRTRRLLVADMDSTIITVECLDELADQAGLKPRIAAITERAMRGELDFAAALTERVGLLAGLEEAALTRTYDERVRLMPGARSLVATMRARGAHTALVSGGFTFFTERVATDAGFHENHANRLEIAGGRLTGRVLPPILGQAAKLEALERLTRDLGLDPAETLAVGDGANDLAMVKAAGLGVAFHAKPVVAEQARVRIDHGDLTALLFLQGIPRAAFAA